MSRRVANQGSRGERAGPGLAAGIPGRDADGGWGGGGEAGLRMRLLRRPGPPRLPRGLAWPPPARRSGQGGAGHGAPRAAAGKTDGAGGRQGVKQQPK